MTQNSSTTHRGRFAPQSAGDLHVRVGEILGVTAWHAVAQADIDSFAAATGDFQWIHTDVQRAAHSPLGTTIAHGLYTLSLGPKLMGEILDLSAFSHSLNYGYERVRFPAPLAVDSRVRMSLGLVATKPAGEQNVDATLRQAFEKEGGNKPVCVADVVVRLTL